MVYLASALLTPRSTIQYCTSVSLYVSLLRQRKFFTRNTNFLLKKIADFKPCTCLHIMRKGAFYGNCFGFAQLDWLSIGIGIAHSSAYTTVAWLSKIKKTHRTLLLSTCRLLLLLLPTSNPPTTMTWSWRGWRPFLPAPT
jgi:hypothetical protein